MADQTLRVGDWVLVHYVPGVEPSTIHLPIWAPIEEIDVEDENMPYMSTFENCSGAMLWFGDDDIVPEAKITDQQWAELATIRLVKGA